jgi:hypothetical protein
MNVECTCADYEAGRTAVDEGRVLSPYLIYQLAHPGCYHAGRRDARLAQAPPARRLQSSHYEGRRSGGDHG